MLLWTGLEKLSMMVDSWLNGDKCKTVRGYERRKVRDYTVLL